MTITSRGVGLYVVGIAFIGTLLLIYGVNEFLLNNTTVGSEWGLVIGSAVLLVLIGIGIRRLIRIAGRRFGPPEKLNQITDSYQWVNRE